MIFGAQVSMRRSQSVEEEQTTLLTDVRDILKRMEDTDGGGSKFGKDYGTGTRSDGAMNASGGGFRPNRGGGSNAGGSDGMDPGGAIGRAIRGETPAGSGPRS